MAIHHGWQAGAVREPPGIGVRAPDGKRLFDILLALALLLPLSAVMLAVAGLLLLMQGRPLLYLSKRMGASGQSFRLLKFRTMVPVAEDGGATGGHKSWRITRLGHLLRRSRIDELPQLFNILAGDMSFVGPRPERPYFVEDLAQKIPYYGVRHTVKPGITGWAQVRYPYGATDEDAKHKLQYDLYYVKNHSLFLDLMILFQTAQVVLWGKGVR